jgi:hypothetical protein
MSDLNDEIKKLQNERKLFTENNSTERINLNSTGQHFDQDLYGGVDKNQYVSSIAADEDEEDDDARLAFSNPSTRKRINPSRSLINESLGEDDGSMENHYREQYGSGLVNTRIADRENDVRSSSPLFSFHLLSLFFSLP